MIALLEMDAPFLDIDETGIERPAQHPGDARHAEQAVLLFRDGRMGAHIALDFGGRLETSLRKAVETFLHDGGERLFGHDHAQPVHLAPFVADRGAEQITTGLHARAHLLDHLTLVLQAFKLALSGDDRLVELAFRRVVEAKIRAFRLGPACGERASQREMKIPVAGEAFHIVEDDDEIFVRLGVQIGKQRHDAGALHEVAAAGYIIREHRFDRIALHRRILAAAMLLALQPVALALLFGTRYPAIDDRRADF